ncbi:phosphotransferase enzyme family protein [Nocardiopsis sp. CNT312]|uniref:phosphotransferase enzyme family protein n=1 Tax=Nocardiopsis sp. CNT312 TaxID=1137268 RepID=UPI00048F94E8|nr:aminoglycoside phosphotransferase family protein [Nocardiopsis sp. CNT312]
MTVDLSHEHILSHALPAAGLAHPAHRASPVRIAENAVYRLPGTIVRIARPGQADAARREVAVARWLADHRVPAVRPLDIDQPVLVDDQAVTFWAELPEHTHGTVDDVAHLLRRLHALPAPDHLDLGRLDPFVRLHTRIADATGHLPDEDLRWLSAHTRHLHQQWEHLPPGQPQSVVHGDAWTGNVARCADGTAVLLDLERCSIGPVEWDLVSTAIKASTVPWLDQDDYARFVQAYGGYDVTAWPGFILMRDIRELRMTLYCAQHAGADPKMQAQARLRIDCLRGRRGGRPWHWAPAL